MKQPSRRWASLRRFLMSCDFIFLRGLPFCHLVVMRTRIVQETYEFAHGLALKCIVTRIAISLINLRQFLCALSQRLLTSSFPGAPLFDRMARLLVAGIVCFLLGFPCECFRPQEIWLVLL